MSYKIISIKKRPWWTRVFTINHWRAAVELSNGVIKYFNCWGNVDSPNSGSLLYSLKSKIKKNRKQPFKDILGTKIEVI